MFSWLCLSKLKPLGLILPVPLRPQWLKWKSATVAILEMQSFELTKLQVLLRLQQLELQR